jgi:predicted nucleic acid-binding protein
VTVLVDSSAWIAFLRGSRRAVTNRVDALLASNITTCGPVVMEVLAGARDEAHLSDLRRLLARATMIATIPSDYETAAQLYRSCRRQGATVRKLVDCFIAAHALRAEVPILHDDRDFDVLARHTSVQVVKL